MSDDTWVRFSGGLARGRLAEARVDREAAEQPRSGVGCAERDELLVRIDVVAVADRERARRPDRFREGKEDDAERAGHEEHDVPERDAREARSRDAGDHVADDLDPLAREVEDGRHHDPDDECHECAGDPWRKPPEHEDPDHRPDPEGSRVRVEVVKALDDRGQLLRDRAAGGREAEEVRQLPDGDRERETDDEPDHDRGGKELREEAEPGPHPPP